MEATKNQKVVATSATKQVAGKQPEKLLAAKRKKKTTKNSSLSSQSFSRLTTKNKRIQRAMDTKKLNQMFKKKEIGATRLYYDLKEDKFYTSEPKDGGGYTPKKFEDDPEQLDRFLYETALKRPYEWIGPTIGDPGDAHPPSSICTNIPIGYQQHGNPYCLTYSLASALLFLGYKPQAQWLWSAAEDISN